MKRVFIEADKTATARKIAPAWVVVLAQTEGGFWGFASWEAYRKWKGIK